MKISIIVPVFNERDSINQLYAEIVSGVNTRDYEIIFIDDGSTDGSAEAIEDLAKSNEKVTLIQFYRNYGKSAALSEGFKHCEGDYIVTMDADLQDDPAEIDNLILKIQEGFDVVSGWKKIVKTHCQNDYLQSYLILLPEFSLK